MNHEQKAELLQEIEDLHNEIVYESDAWYLISKVEALRDRVLGMEIEEEKSQKNPDETIDNGDF